MTYANSLVDLVGNTPLLRLNRVTQGLSPLVLAKVESLNPGGSVKDRIALAMVLAAEESGALQPGGTIVEPTSGNTGVGLAIVASQRGYSPAATAGPTSSRASARTSGRRPTTPRWSTGSWRSATRTRSS